MQRRMHRRTRSNPITVSDTKILSLEGDVEKPDENNLHKRSISTNALLPPIDCAIKDDSQSKSVFFANNASLLTTVQKIKKTLCRLSPSRKSKHPKMKIPQGSGSFEANDPMKLHPETGDNLNDKESHAHDKKPQRPKEPSSQPLSPPRPAPRRSQPLTARKGHSSSEPHAKPDEAKSSKTSKSDFPAPNPKTSEQPATNRPHKRSKANPESSASNQAGKQEKQPSHQSSPNRKPPNHQGKHQEPRQSTSSNQSQMQVISRRPTSQPPSKEKSSAWLTTQPTTSEFEIVGYSSSEIQRQNNSTAAHPAAKKVSIATETRIRQTSQHPSRKMSSSNKGRGVGVVDRNAHSNADLETDDCKIQLPNYVREQWETINEMKDKIATLTAENKETRKQVHLLRRIKKDLEDMLSKTSEENRELVVTCDMLRDKHVKRPGMRSIGVQVSSNVESSDGQPFCIRCQRNQHHFDIGLRSQSRDGFVPSLRDETICLEVETQNVVNHINSLARTVDRHCISNKRFRFKMEKIIHAFNGPSRGPPPIDRALKCNKSHDLK